MMTIGIKEQTMSEEMAVIVGGSSGIGEATARAFLAAGARVVIVGRDPARLDTALGRLPGAHGVRADARDGVAIRRVLEELGGFEHLVLCQSGGKGGGPFATLALDDLRAGLEGKLLAQLTAIQAALGLVRSSITLVSAASARAAIPGTCGLAAINGAIEAMVPPLAVELAPVRVNAVSPGVIDTPWWNAFPPDAKRAMFEKTSASLPVGRVGRAEEVAAAITMVAANGFMTGSVVEVAGGAQLVR